MRVLGLDGGIASIGWALIEISAADGASDGRIIDAGTWMFDAPEEKSQTGSHCDHKSKSLHVFLLWRHLLKGSPFRCFSCPNLCRSTRSPPLS